MKGYTYSEELKRLKNPYVFPGNDSLSTINTGNIDVNDTIKPIDKKDANSELEKNEFVLQPTGNLYKVLGNTHSSGGTPVKLPTGSFIYSNYKPLAISKDDKDLFQFKNNGKYKPINNTPANILKKEIDTEHHNRMIAISGSNEHDDISKKSAALMLKKNFKKLGQIAYLQEEKKGFPTGVPIFAQGSAPVKNDETNDADVLQKQYKLGGMLKKYQLAGPVWGGDKYSGRKNASMYSQDDWNNFAQKLGFKGNPLEFQKFLYSKPEFKPILDGLQKEHLPGPNQGMMDGKIGYRWDAVMDAYRHNNRPPAELTPVGPGNPGYPDMTNKNIGNSNLTVTNTPYTPPSTNEGDDNTNTLPYDPRVPFSPWQKANIGYAAFNAATVGKYVPKRSQVDFNPVTLERINSQPYINQINSEESNAYKLNTSLTPIQARANNSQIYGSGLDKSSQVLGSIDNQNRQISNQENMYNNQGANRAGEQNTQLDSTYYDAVQRVNQNYEREQRTARNQIVSLANMYKSSNDELQNELASQPTFGTKDVFQDPISGRTYSDINQVPNNIRGRVIKRRQASPVYDYNTKTNSIYYTGAGADLNSLPDESGNRMTDLVQLAKMLSEQFPGQDAASLRAAAYYMGKQK